MKNQKAKSKLAKEGSKADKDIVMPMENVEHKKHMEEMEAEDDAKALLHAEKIRKDGKRHGKAMEHLKKQKESIKSLEQLKKIVADKMRYDDLNGESDE